MQANAITVIHKFIRREMFDFAERLFRAGPEQVGDIREELERIGQLLETHAVQENTRLEPLLRQIDRHSRTGSSRTMGVSSASSRGCSTRRNRSIRAPRRAMRTCCSFTWTGIDT